MNISTSVVTLSASKSAAGKDRLAYSVGQAKIPLVWATTIVYYEQFVERFQQLTPGRSQQIEAANEFLVYLITSGNHDTGR